MAKMFRPRRGTTTANASLVGGVGELTVDITKGTVRVHDGSTAGGTELARTKDLPTVPTKLSQLTNDKGFITSSPPNLELNPGTSVNHGGYIDFHFAGSTADYTARIIESASGLLAITAANGVTINGTKVALTTDLSAYATTASLSSYALTSAIPTKTSQLTNDSGFLTSHQSLASCVKTSGGTISGSLTVTGTLKGGTVQATSDRRLKENLSTPTFDLSSLKAYRYTFRNEGRPTYHVGLIAQDVQKVIPEAVTAGGKEGFLSLDYNAVVAALVNKVNELQQQIDELKERQNG